MRPLPTLPTSKPQARMSSSLDGVHRVDFYTRLDILIIETVLGMVRGHITTETHSTVLNKRNVWAVKCSDLILSIVNIRIYYHRQSQNRTSLLSETYLIRSKNQMVFFFFWKELYKREFLFQSVGNRVHLYVELHVLCILSIINKNVNQAEESLNHHFNLSIQMALQNWSKNM